MVTMYRSATPNAFFTGYRDNPAPGLQDRQVITPAHCPFGYILAEWGKPNVPYYVVGNQLQTIFGEHTWDAQGEYFTHYSDFALNVFNKNVNAQFLMRLQPEKSSTAYGRLWCEVVEFDVPQYVRVEGTNQLKLGADGRPVPVEGAGATLPGYKLRWHWEPIDDPEDENLGFGMASVKDGTLTGTAGKTARMYPIGDFPATCFGGRGNRLAIAPWAPHDRSLVPNDVKYIEQTGNYLYRMGFHEKARDGSVQPWYSINGEAYFDFTFNPKQTKPGTGAKVSLDALYREKYQNYETATSGEQVMGPMDGFTVYLTNVKTVLELLHAAELPQQSAKHPTNVHSINFMGARDYYGDPYYAIVMADVAEITGTALLLNEHTKSYLSGGADGQMSAADYDELVAGKLSAFGKDGVELYDMARYPFTAMWDSGFSIDTKNKFWPLTSIRPDLFLGVATQDVNLPLNSLDDEMATATALLARAYIQVESAIYQTPFSRGSLMPWAGFITDGSAYDKLVTGNRELADKISQWFGGGEGGWTPGKDMDLYPQKVISKMKLANYSFAPYSMREKAWQNQMIAVEYSDQNEQIFSGMQTINPNDSSTLNSIVTVWGCIAATRAALKAYKWLVGNNKFTPEQMIKRSNEIITDELKNIGQDRLIFRPETTFTKADTDAGYAWTTLVHVYANGMKTVNTITINSHTMQELEQ